LTNKIYNTIIHFILIKFKGDRKMKINKIIISVVALFLSLTFVSYGNEKKSVDYSQSKYWLAIPSSIEKEVDVFYIYPTAWHRVDPNEPNICAIDNHSMLDGSKTAYKVQATAFETIGNIYAPYYRQVDAVYAYSLPSEADRTKLLSGIPKSDIFAAFDYYIKHYNNGRPFILAAHSQGSKMLSFLLSEYMKEHPDVYKRMVAAYVIGFSITKDYLAENPHLKFAEGPDDTGVIISYNTEAPNVTGNNPLLLPGAIAINPITWTREETLATADKNLGSIVLKGKDEIISFKEKNYADARVDKTRGVVICSTVDVEKLSPGHESFAKGVYHIYDYPFYYYNLRENSANRTKNFLNK
jgi:hypothetical protein